MHRLAGGISRATLEDRAGVGQTRSAAGGDGSGQTRVLERAVAGYVARKAYGWARRRIDGPRKVSLPLSFEDDASDEAQVPIAPAFERTDDERAVVQPAPRCGTEGAGRRAEDGRASTNRPARGRAGHHLHRVSRHARCDTRCNRQPSADHHASWRSDGA